MGRAASRGIGSPVGGRATTLPGVLRASPLAAVRTAAGEVRAPAAGASSRAAAAGERGSGSGSSWGRLTASPGAAPGWGRAEVPQCGTEFVCPG